MDFSSLTSCLRDHGFPWRYADTLFEAGVMLCPSCHTDLDHGWTRHDLWKRRHGPG